VNTIAARAQATEATLHARFGAKDGPTTAHLRARDQRWRRDLEDFRGRGFVDAAAELPERTHPARAVIDDHERSVRSHLEDAATDAGCTEPVDVAEQWVRAR
jgi:hypothetical protein